MAELTAVAVRNARPREAMYRLAAGKGLYLQVMPSGGRYWRLKYRVGGKARMLGLGVYPDVSLADARAARDEARTLLSSGTDPSVQRRVDRLAQDSARENSMEAVCRAWYAEHAPAWVPDYARGVNRRLEMNIYPWLGKLPIAKVTSGMLLECLQRVVDRRAVETAHRTLGYITDVYRWAARKNITTHNVAADLEGALPIAVGGHYPAITDPEQIGVLLRAIDGYTGTYVVRYALQLSPLVFTRPSELRKATWPEFDLDGAAWEVPAARMKMDSHKKAVSPPHLVPLSRQAVAILRELRPLATGDGTGYIFPGQRDPRRPLSDAAVNGALRSLGYKGKMVAHGFRTTASTVLNELGKWRADVIEAQLAHKDKNVIRGIYNRAKYLRERLPMMQAWADHLDTLRQTWPANRRPAAQRGNTA